MPRQPVNLEDIMRRAATAIGAGDWPAAETALGECLRQRPGDPALAYNLALVEKRLGKTDSAEERLATLLAATPGHVNARFEYAATLMDRGAESEALREFETYLRAVPDDAAARLNAGRLSLRLDRAAEALAHLDAADAGRPGDPAIRLARAEALRDLARIDEADRIFRDLFAETPELRPAILKAMSQGARGRIALGPGISS